MPMSRARTPTSRRGEHGSVFLLSIIVLTVLFLLGVARARLVPAEPHAGGKAASLERPVGQQAGGPPALGRGRFQLDAVRVPPLRAELDARVPVRRAGRE